jgi:VanZ family protein
MSNSGGAATVQQIAPPRRAKPHDPKSLRFWLNAWLPVAFGIGIIVLESTPWFGADRTTGPLRSLWERLFGPVSTSAWNVIHHLIRKSGHFIGYGVIALAWLRAWWITLPGSGYFQDAALAVLGTGLLATWDEWHQSFLPNRGSSPWDVLLDCCGGITLCLVAYLYSRLFRPERLSRNQRS